ncbi:MAG: hypothetical protein ACON4P_05055 [Candidatus Puniceispirillales bacterium]
MLLFSVFIGTFAIAESALSGFTTSRIGGTKGLVVTPVADLLLSLQEIINDPNTPLSNSTLEGLNLDVSVFGGFPLDSFELAYIQAMLAGRDLGSSQAGLQSVFDGSLTDNASACPGGNCSQAAADWQHEQISEDNSSSDYGDWSLISAAMLDDLIGISGYTDSVLSASGATISTLQNDLLFQSIANLEGRSDLPSTTAIRNRINYAGGFVTPVAGGDNASTSQYSTVQSVVDAYLVSSDRENFTPADFYACYSNTESQRSGGPNACSVTASYWSSQQTILNDFAALITRLEDNNTLSQADLESIGLDLAALGSPIRPWQLENLSSILSTSATAISDWQTTITNFNTPAAARWKIGQVAAGNSGHEDSDIDNDLLDTAIGSSFSSATAFSAAAGTSASGFAAATVFDNLTAPDNNAPNIQSSLLSYIGFTNAQYAGWNNNSDKTNFSVADFNACFASNDPLTGGSSTCTITNANWTDLNTILTAATDNATASLTQAALDDLFGISGSSYSIDLSDSVNLAYVQECIVDLDGPTSTSISACVTGSTAQVAAKWKIYQIALGTDNATHPTTDLTAGLYDRAVNQTSGFLQDVLDAKPSFSLTDLQAALSSYFTNNGLTDQSSDDAFKLFPVSRVGFRESLTSYNQWVLNSGFSVGAVNNASEDIVRVWEACRRSLDNLSGGTGTCNPTYAQWRDRAADRAANNIIQVRSNDYFHGVNSGPRVYTETLMGITINLHDVSTRDSTQWQWTDQNGNSQTERHGWVTGNGSYAFWYGGLAESPPIGALLTRQ